MIRVQACWTAKYWGSVSRGNDRRNEGEGMRGLVSLLVQMEVRRLVGKRSTCGDPPPGPRRWRRGLRFG